jgi:predicted ATPase
MRTLHKIELRNFLSFANLSLELEHLNVLVGPNGAGKTNILQAFRFLGEIARSDLVPAIDHMGGFENLLFRGSVRKDSRIDLKLAGVMSPHASAKALDEYSIGFQERPMRARNSEMPVRRLVERNEEIVIKRLPGRGRRITLHGGEVKIAPVEAGKQMRPPPPLSVQESATGLATLRRLGKEYGADGIEAIAQTFEQLRLFEIDVERARHPHRAPTASQLRADAANLAPFLLYLKSEHAEFFKNVVEDLRFVLPSFAEFVFTQLGGPDEFVRIDLKESHLTGVTPLARASYGTVRAIALFAMLNDPDPPRLTCIEEVDHGLHPHALDRLVDRIRDASARTQIVIATHSPALVNRLTPSELVVVERDRETGSGRAIRMDAAKVAKLSQEAGYGLGELWFSGALGGGL